MSSSGDESIDDPGQDISNDARVEESDVGDPDHSEDQWAHELQEVGSGRRDIDIDIRELISQNVGNVAQFLINDRWPGVGAEEIRGVRVSGHAPECKVGHFDAAVIKVILKLTKSRCVFF